MDLSNSFVSRGGAACWFVGCLSFSPLTHVDWSGWREPADTFHPLRSSFLLFLFFPSFFCFPSPPRVPLSLLFPLFSRTPSHSESRRGRSFMLETIHRGPRHRCFKRDRGDRVSLNWLVCLSTWPLISGYLSDEWTEGGNVCVWSLNCGIDRVLL